MTNNVFVLVLCSIIFFVANEHVISYGRVEARPFGDQEKLGLKHEGTVTTIKGGNGDTIVCVDVYKQPALRHPLIKDIQVEPSSLPEGLKMHKSSPTVAQDLSGFEGCSEGTIPIRRGTSSPNSKPRRQTSVLGFVEEKANQVREEIHEYAIAETEFSTARYHGAQATVSVWNPKVEAGQEMSISQIWLLANSSHDLNQLNTIEAGWIVNPNRYKDDLTRFFIHWTSDGYQTTGCMDLDCPGFVQTNKDFVIGGPLSPISQYGHGSAELTISIFKDKVSGDYWLDVDGAKVGYWPKSIFTTLANGATKVQFGGQISDTQVLGHHTSTQMGSGHFAREGYGKSSYFDGPLVIDSSDAAKVPEKLNFVTSNPGCYDSQVRNDPALGSGTVFYYGGPGYSRSCQ